MMVRTRRNIVFTVLLFCAAWVLIVLVFSNGRTQKMASISSFSPSEKSFTIPTAQATTAPRPESAFPDGVGAHAEPKVNRQLTQEELDELTQSKDDAEKGDAEKDDAEKDEVSKAPELTKSDLTEDIQDTSSIEDLAGRDQRAESHRIIYGVVDKESLSNQSKEDIEYLLKTFIRAWYSRGYYPKLVEIGRLQSHSKSSSIFQTKDLKAKWIASRVGLLSVLGGGMIAEITTLSEYEPAEDSEDDQENKVLASLMSTGMIFPAAKPEVLERLLDKILNEDEELLASIANLNPKKMTFDKDATKKIRLAVKNASEARNIICYGANAKFLSFMNKEYSRLKAATNDVDVIFLDSTTSPEELTELMGENNVELTDFLINKILVPKNSYSNAAKLLEYGFGVYFDLTYPKVGSEEENSNNLAQATPDIVKWAYEKIEEKLQVIDSIEKQIPQFVLAQ